MTAADKGHRDTSGSPAPAVCALVVTYGGDLMTAKAVCNHSPFPFIPETPQGARISEPSAFMFVSTDYVGLAK